MGVVSMEWAGPRRGQPEGVQRGGSRLCGARGAGTRRDGSAEGWECRGMGTRSYRDTEVPALHYRIKAVPTVGSRYPAPSCPGAVGPTLRTDSRRASRRCTVPGQDLRSPTGPLGGTCPELLRTHCSSRLDPGDSHTAWSWDCNTPACPRDPQLPEGDGAERARRRGGGSPCPPAWSSSLLPPPALDGPLAPSPQRPSRRRAL